MLGLSRQQLQAWERQGLIRRLEEYSFSDLLALRTLIQLRKNRVPGARIREAILALRRRWGSSENPLAELKIFPEGRRLRVKVDDALLEPITGQLLLPFEAAGSENESNKIVQFPRSKLQTRERQQRVEQLFSQAVELEQQGRVAEALRCYRDLLELEPNHAPTLVNLGTICFHARDYVQARTYYEHAVRVAPDYALARFNLGNLLDELGLFEAALEQYQEALRLKPDYADAHFNIASVYKALGQPLRALQHWRQYLKYDGTSEWARIARREIERICQQMLVQPGSRA